MDKKYKNLGANTILVFIGNAGSKLIALLLLPFYTRWLTVSDYGVTDIITVYSTLLVGLFSCCIYDALLVFPKGKDETCKRTYFTSGANFLFLANLLTIVIFYILSFFFKKLGFENSFANYIWYIFLIMVSDSILKCTQNFCRSIDKMKIYSVTGVLVTLFTALFSFILIPYFGVKGYVISIAVANISSSLFAFLITRSYCYYDLALFKLSSCKEMLLYSVPLIPNAIMWWIVSALNRPLMEKYVGLEGIGFFAVANKFPGIIAMLFSVFLVSWQISVLEEYGKNGYSFFYNRVFKLFIMMSSLLWIGITLFSKSMIMLFTTSNYYSAWQYIPILALGTLFSNIGGFVGCNFSAVRKSKYYFYSSVWSAICAIILNLLLIPIYGVWGAVFSFTISLMVMAVTRILYSWKYVPIRNLNHYCFLLVLDLSVFLLLFYNVSILFLFVDCLILIVVHVYFNKDEIKDVFSFLMRKQINYKLKK